MLPLMFIFVRKSGATVMNRTQMTRIKRMIRIKFVKLFIPFGQASTKMQTDLPRALARGLTERQKRALAHKKKL